jgi:DNA-binding LacI/PurR family transcriptional regulator
MRATVRDVASWAGVSPKTVSNVLNGTVNVRPATRARVEAAMVALDYVPNLSARGLRNGRTGMIAIALSDLQVPFFAEMMHHFVNAAAARGLQVQVEETGWDPGREARLLSRAREHQVDGLILNPVNHETTAVKPGIALPPVVLIGEVYLPIVDMVWMDNAAAIADLTGELITTGHRRIALLGMSDHPAAIARLDGYRQALRSAGIPTDPRLEIASDDWRPTSAARALNAFLDSDPGPVDAVVCCTDGAAMGALLALHAHGLRVPEDVSVTGYDNINDSAITVPPLTTIDFDKAYVADTAIALLMQRIADPGGSPRKVTLPHRLVWRSSTTSR